MPRDHEKLRVFQLADQLVPDIYALTRPFPPEERYALQLQLRRAAVSAPTNVVEGSSRESLGDYLRFLDISLGSSNEVRYLLRLSSRLGFIPSAKSDACRERYDELSRSLQKLITSLRPLRSSGSFRGRERR